MCTMEQFVTAYILFELLGGGGWNLAVIRPFTEPEYKLLKTYAL
jgi:hypothetical protein